MRGGSAPHARVGEVPGLPDELAVQVLAEQHPSGGGERVGDLDQVERAARHDGQLLLVPALAPALLPVPATLVTVHTT